MDLCNFFSSSSDLLIFDLIVAEAASEHPLPLRSNLEMIKKRPLTKGIGRDVGVLLGFLRPAWVLSTMLILFIPTGPDPSRFELKVQALIEVFACPSFWWGFCAGFRLSNRVEIQ